MAIGIGGTVKYVRHGEPQRGTRAGLVAERKVVHPVVVHLQEVADLPVEGAIVALLPYVVSLPARAEVAALPAEIELCGVGRTADLFFAVDDRQAGGARDCLIQSAAVEGIVRRKIAARGASLSSESPWSGLSPIENGCRCNAGRGISAAAGPVIFREPSRLMK